MEVWQVALLLIAIVVAVGAICVGLFYRFLWKNYIGPLLQQFFGKDKNG